MSALTLSTWPSTSRSGAIGRDDRDPAGLEQVEHGGRVDLDDVADQADVVLLAVDDDAATAGAEQPGVLAGQADGHRAVLVEQSDQLAPDLAGQHHPHDVHDLGRGDPQPALELGVEAEPVEHRLDLRAAAVHDDRPQPGQAQEDDVLRERRLELVVDHRVAAVLDDDQGPAEALEPGQRLDQGQRLGLGDAQRGGVDRAAQGLLGGCHRVRSFVGLSVSSVCRAQLE